MGDKSKIVILGAGLAGLSTAYHLEDLPVEDLPVKKDYEIYEKEEEVGGLCRSKDINGFTPLEKATPGIRKNSLTGFTFDCSGHLLHFKNRYTLDLLKRLLNGNLISHQRNSWIFSKGVYTRYPFQANTYGLPSSVVKECLMGLVEARGSNGDGGSDRNGTFEDWIFHTFGEGIAKHFMIPYNSKFWTVHPSELTCEWLDGYIPVPALEDVLDGALSDSTKPFGYNQEFWYPQDGGIREVPLAFQRQVKKVHTLKEATRIDIEKKEVEFKDGEIIRFDKLVSSLPLIEMKRLINNIPEDVATAFRKLRYTSIFNLNLGIDREEITDKHWIYFPEDDFVFYRVGFPINFSSSVIPKGKSSIYIEISYSKDKPIDKTSIVQRIIRDLKKAGLIFNDSEIVAHDIVDIKYGYIIYDKNYRNAVGTILDFLARKDIYSLGRYGSWRYISMEDAILDGKRIAGFLSKDA